MTSEIEITQADAWIVWSNEHRAFWAPNRCGYTGRIEKAGRYTREEAENICRYAAPRANSTINVGTPPEICMPAPESLTTMQRERDEAREFARQAVEVLRAIVEWPSNGPYLRIAPYKEAVAFLARYEGEVK